MPDDRAGGTAQRSFISEMRRLRRQAGDPSLPSMHRTSQRLYAEGAITVVLSRSTISDVLSGTKRAKLPSWPWVFGFLETCRAAAAETKLDLETLGSTAEWNAGWQAARAAEDACPSGVGPCRGRICRCGGGSP
ncbi:hypothetical protein GCM10010191_59350 [Actinomadura vinacea]|uniref:XRE family transcriptional regulator n=1 Tax=Actinomadura vinacea TaxID=115336 RepID=A0ABN3JQ66_9ACTN